MTATGYPDLFDDATAPLIDAYRCRAVDDGRRCQLFAGHTDPHASAWFEERPFTPGQSHRPGPAHWSRWDGGREWEQAPGSERLGWCCLYRS